MEQVPLVTKQLLVERSASLSSPPPAGSGCHSWPYWRSTCSSILSAVLPPLPTGFFRSAPLTHTGKAAAGSGAGGFSERLPYGWIQRIGKEVNSGKSVRQAHLPKGIQAHRRRISRLSAHLQRQICQNRPTLLTYHHPEPCSGLYCLSVRERKLAKTRI
jgi:hypothetical protein